MPTPQIQNKAPVLFCDFDGTISERDVIIMIQEAFAPEGWRDIVDQILNTRTLSIREGVIQLFKRIPGSQKDEMEAFVKENVKIRPGFEALLNFCQQHRIPFRVLSGGVDFFIRPILAPFQDKLTVFCNSATFTPDAIHLEMPYYQENCEPCGQCACCKISLMEPFSPETHYRIAIGDSLTDLPMARVADWTFARGQLIDYCQQENISTTPYETFYDVLEALQHKLEFSYAN
jgi:2-hydroxy-3-keto-5-methylthiopentenyl-1-phosphate phosphatase